MPRITPRALSRRPAAARAALPGLPVLASFPFPILAAVLAALLTAALATAPAALASDAWPGRIVYRESSPGEEHYKQYDVVRDNGEVVITLREKDVVQVIRTPEGRGTSRETYRNLKTGDSVEVVREAGEVAFSGRIGGKDTRRKDPCGDSPWYGSTLLLKDFILSDRESQTFHLTRPEEAALVTLEATRQGRETLPTALGPVEAVKVKVTLPGMKAWMWKSQYWFRASDGILLRSEGTRGPASPVYVIEIVRESAEPAPTLSQGPAQGPAQGAAAQNPAP